MMSFIYNNQAIVGLICVVLFLMLLILIIKGLPTTVKKKEKKQEKKQDKQESQAPVEEKKQEAKEPESGEIKAEEKTQNKDEKSKKEDKKPKIVQIYKRESREEKNENKPKNDPIYDRNVEFVNTSKNIAKFKSFAEDSPKEDEKDEFGFVEDYQDDCEFCEDKVKHFDHSRRLSSVMKEDGFDEMFGSHISDKYLNINTEKHLKNDEEFRSSLYSRTDGMMSNINNRFGYDQDYGESLFTSNNGFAGKEEGLDEDVNIDMKTALIAETYFNRKKKK